MHVEVSPIRFARKGAIFRPREHLLPRYTTPDEMSRCGIRLSRLRLGMPLGAVGMPNAIADAIVSACACNCQWQRRCHLLPRRGVSI